jgi:ribonuclease-3
MIFNLTELEEIIEYKFKDPSLLRQCFVHSSYAYENKGEKDFERLEFLGDSILGYVVSEYLYNNTTVDEGSMTQFKQLLVSGKPLNEISKKLGLNKFIIVSDSLKDNITDALCENVVESLIAGLYLDGGLEVAKKFIYKNIINYKREKSIKQLKEQDGKTLLKEYCEKLKLGKIEYVLLDKTGQDHAPEFKIAVYVDSKKIAESRGKSKKMAEQKASLLAYNILKNNKKRKKKNA